MIRAKQQHKASQCQESGFTIIESLMAIIVGSILMIAIAPVLALSVATRVQAKRVELATIAAKSYLDGLRSGAIDPPINIITNQSPAEVNAPSSATLTCPVNRGFCSTPADVFCIDGDGDNECKSSSVKDVVIQVAAYNPNLPSNYSSLENKDKIKTLNQSGYIVGIRVYQANAFTENRTLLTANEATEKGGNRVASSFSGGTGLSTKQAPLVEMTTEIFAKGEDGTKFAELCKRLEAANGVKPEDSKCNT